MDAANAGFGRGTPQTGRQPVLYPAMNIVKSTREFEQWLRQRTTLVKRDLDLKHRYMAEAPFPFFRATFYRWMQLWPEICPQVAQAPKLLAVGDLHVENFGTWRDVEGRLVWGVNDFDEAATLPYTLDLVRLATSALMAIEAGHLSIKAKDACVAILESYEKSLATGGLPFVLSEDHAWLRDIATVESRDPVHFWQTMDALPCVRQKISKSARKALQCLLPKEAVIRRIATRTAGVGSLGHMRLVAIADYNGGRIAREAKAQTPSAVHWAAGKTEAEIEYEIILKAAVRCPDPFVHMRGPWLVRRLAPYCSRIELTMLPRDHDPLRLLAAMGSETANVHLGSRKVIKKVKEDLKRRKANWLAAAARDMTEAISKDWRLWRESDSR